jgi:nucleotide-binding universal stress UspA family protein
MDCFLSAITFDADQREEKARFPIRTILHPTDFTEQANNAFQLACALARDYDAKLVVLHVFLTPGVSLVEGGVFPVYMEVPRDKLLKELNEIQPSDPTIAVERLLVEGDAAYEILVAANANDVDLIVMGTHGRGGLSRLVMGSVAEAVSRKADCPVLTVRTKLGVVDGGPAESEQEEAVAIR